MKNKEVLSLLINPFVRIAGGKALLIGIVVFVVSILLAYCGNMVFDGVVDAHFNDNANLGRALLVPSIALVIFIVTLYLTGRLLSKSSIRFIDVAGTVTLARTPFILISLAVLIPGVYDYNIIITQNLLAQSYSEITVMQWIVFFSFLAVSMIAAIWFVILAYKAFSVSCNISGAKGIMGFVAALLFSEIVAAIAIYQLSKCFF
ncbi:hypothetical protein G7051_12290 [Dysgonomonas sp. HDW5B]|uniref:hypothetical protein n=1 Tax=Dysgonomonas sp. HDW5B TaxID=2714927 RepID=UPI00140BFCF1|nr:hypothetical protein [Dysgonomonas sp. HDW5B]QIK55076.1 hypothetical protein G7051_12290 [Dysgonomonas sp. HDW5B]